MATKIVQMLDFFFFEMSFDTPIFKVLVFASDFSDFEFLNSSK